MSTVYHPEVFIENCGCPGCLKMLLTSGRFFTRLKNGLSRGKSLSMNIWDELGKARDASVLSNEGFLSLQSCQHHVGVGWLSV